MNDSDQLSQSFSAKAERFQQPATDQTTQQMGTILGGHFFRQALGLLSSAMLARGLGPALWSTFSIIGAVVSIGSAVADFGLSNSAVRLIAGLRSSDELEQAKDFASLYAYLKIAGASLALGLLMAFPQPVVRLLQLPAEKGQVYLRLGATILFASALSRGAGEILRALQRFRRIVIVQLALVISLVLLLALPYLNQRLHLELALAINASSVFISAIVGFFLLPQPWRNKLFRVPRFNYRKLMRLLSFSRWIWISSSLGIILVHLDLLMINTYLDPVNVGQYALAANLSLKVGILPQTMHTVLLPKASELTDVGRIRSYLGSNLLRSVFILGAVLLLLPFAPSFIRYVYGAEFEASIPIFFGLASIVLLDVLALPLLLLVYPLDIPKGLAAADSLAVGSLFLVAWLTIPMWGVFGAVAARGVAQVTRIFLIGFFIRRRLGQSVLRR